jgi:hypothetical protein
MRLAGASSVVLLASLVLQALGAPAYAERVVALAPLATMGGEDKSTSSQQLTAALERALAALPDTKVVAAAHVGQAVAVSKRAQLKTCEGDPSCVAELGKLVGAQIVVTGEIGGLGESRVVYLDAVDVATGKELRATTLAMGGKDDSLATDGAVVRLLDPDRYKGTVHLAIDVAGATVFVNGSRVTLSNGALALPVGTQAVRVTHPEYHDFVRFVDVPFGKTVDVAVGMQQYPIVEQNVRGLPTSRDHIDYVDPPLWRRWYVVAPVGIAIATVVAVIIASSNRVCKAGPACTCVSLNGAPCD